MRRQWRDRPISATGCGRTLHLVDVDNLLGDPSTTDRAWIRSRLAEYQRRSQYRTGDHVVIATGRNGLHVLECELAWPGALYRRRAGVDGADLELVEQARWAATSGRYARVVIGSGDGHFAVVVDELAAARVHVEVIARSTSVARSLSSSAALCRLMAC